MSSAGFQQSPEAKLKPEAGSGRRSQRSVRPAALRKVARSAAGRHLAKPSKPAAAEPTSGVLAGSADSRGARRADRSAKRAKRGAPGRAKRYSKPHREPGARCPWSKQFTRRGLGPMIGSRRPPVHSPHDRDVAGPDSLHAGTASPLYAALAPRAAHLVVAGRAVRDREHLAIGPALAEGTSQPTRSHRCPSVASFCTTPCAPPLWS